MPTRRATTRKTVRSTASRKEASRRASEPSTRRIYQDRTEAAHRTPRTRREEEERSYSSRTGSISRQEAGRRGAEARWGRRSAEDIRTSARVRQGLTRQEAGRLGAEARWGRRENEGIRHASNACQGQRCWETDACSGRNDDNLYNRSSNRQNGQRHREEAGRRGADARWGRYDEQRNARIGWRGGRNFDHFQDRYQIEGGCHRSEPWSFNYEEEDQELIYAGRRQGRQNREDVGRRGADARWSHYDERTNEYENALYGYPSDRY